MKLPWWTFGALCLCSLTTSASAAACGWRGLVLSAASLLAGAIMVWATLADLRGARS